MANHYLIHLPHCGTKIPKEYIGDYYLDKKELEENILEYADIYTDELFDNLFNKFGGVKNDYSRLFFDAERFGDDNLETMHKDFKLGWFYENTILKKKPLRGTQNKSTIRKYFDNHHNLLNKLTQDKLSKYGKCTIMDCHSFSNQPYWFLDTNMVSPDICIGFEENHLDNNLKNIILDEFKDMNIAINNPYAGSLVPTNYWAKDTRVKSVMIEINKKLYVESDNITKNKNFNQIKQKLDNILNKISN